MKALLDVNVVLDVLINRQPWVVDSQPVWDAVFSTQIEGFVAATALTNLYYIAGRLVSEPIALECVRRCLATLQVIPVDESILKAAIDLSGPDFEDNVMVRCAIIGGMDAIVTRDLTGFSASPVPALSPRALIERLAAEAVDPAPDQ